MSAPMKSGLALAVGSSVALSGAAMLAMQQSAKTQEGPASVYKNQAEKDAAPGTSDVAMSTSEISDVVTGNARGSQRPTSRPESKDNHE
ncbi:hypothetical protein CYLTODRAFT_417648 [Cylindrobasidium torrendii FP15055 ss-10]|uniref:Uncharacterized protein n=1 Tax=Cylindrobasidium torrendii FP15055 ss-10 TaxID=1314674 RepID=A0A0D7BR39_9AGAR|nr:hypothetical protein CYLTODRAFT_417648 [Cylindrobasidium torrendii FP15055 ss-10]